MTAAASQDLARSLLSRGGEGLSRLERRPRGRRALLRAIALALPMRFEPETANDLHATFELRIAQPPARDRAVMDLHHQVVQIDHAARFALQISNRRCIVRPGPAPDAGAAVVIGAQDAIRLASGAVGWAELLGAGRLVLSGDPFLALRFPTLFRLHARGLGRLPAWPQASRR